MTLSLGVASEGGEGTTETSALLRAASAALKRAQQGGKNRTALADDSGVAIDAVPDGG
jgi:PleD family two-component response regulator